MTVPDDPIELLQARYAESIGVLPDMPKRFPTAPGDGESLHVEYVDGRYVLILTRDGVERQRRSSADVEQAMYLILSSVAFDRHVGTLTMDCRGEPHASDASPPSLFAAGAKGSVGAKGSG